MYRRNQIVIKDHIKKFRFERFFVDAQLICDEAGGKVTKKTIKGMSLQHFFSLCALNGINITFTLVKRD